MKVNIWWMIKCSLLKVYFVWNFRNKVVVDFIYLTLSISNLFGNNKVRFCNKTKRNIEFFPSNNYCLVAIILSFLLLSISVIISSDRILLGFLLGYLDSFFTWILFFNILINIIHIIWVSNKSFKPALSPLLISNWYFA